MLCAFIPADQFGRDLRGTQDYRRPPARVRAAADVIEALIFPVLVRRAQEGFPPALRVRAVNRAAGHQVTAAEPPRSPDVGNDYFVFNVGEPSAPQSGHHTPPRFTDVSFIPLTIIRRGVRHDE